MMGAVDLKPAGQHSFTDSLATVIANDANVNHTGYVIGYMLLHCCICYVATTTTYTNILIYVQCMQLHMSTTYYVPIMICSMHAIAHVYNILRTYYDMFNACNCTCLQQTTYLL